MPQSLADGGDKEGYRPAGRKCLITSGLDGSLLKDDLLS